MNPRPRIFLDGLLVNENPTGVGRSILELTRAMSEKTWGMDFSVLVTHPESFAWLLDCPEWEVVSCPGARGGTLRKAFFTQMMLPKLCRELNASLLHSLQFVAPLTLSCPNVVTVHDLSWLLYPHTVEQPRRSYYRWLVPRTLKKATTIVTNSAATAKDVKRFFPHCSSVEITRFGTPSWVWEKEDPGLEPSILAGSTRPFFLFVGTLEPRKNLESILEAYRFLLEESLPEKGYSWPSLVLVGGKGWKDSNLKRMMEPLLQSGDLLVLDYCGIDELRALYQSALALVFPSLHEGFGFPILEAMSFGLPVITSDLGAMKEVAGEKALLVDPSDVAELQGALKSLSQSPELRSLLANSGPARAKKWSWDITAAATIEVYRKVVKKK